MNDEIREYISCPQFGDNHYGKWGALNLEQRKKIKYLLHKIDILEMIEKEYIQLQSNWNSLREWLKTERDYYFENYYYSDFNAYGSKLNDVLDKMNELEGVDNGTN